MAETKPTNRTTSQSDEEDPAFESSESTAKDEVFYSYTTPSFQKYEHSWTWYGVFGAIGLLLLGYAITSRSPMMFVVFLLLFLLTLFWVQKEPNEIEVQITDNGLRIDNEHTYPYTKIDFFGILYGDEMAYISLYLTEGTVRYVKIPLGNEKPEDIAAILNQFIERHDNQERLVDKLDMIFRI